MSALSFEQLRQRIRDASITQERLALQLGFDPSLFSRYLRGLRPAPDGFAARVGAALDKLEQAEAAADEARQRVLAGAAK